jgi:hypothetical protein
MKSEQGLNGFFGWLKRHIHAIATICTLVGLAPLGAVLEAISIDTGTGSSGTSYDGMGDNTMRKIGEYEPTATESLILDQWVEIQLTPFYRALLIQIKSAFESNSHDLQLQIINEVIMKMCVVKSFYTTNDTNGLSLLAINLRSELIKEIFVPIDDMIGNSILNDNSVYLENYIANNISPSQFLPLHVQNLSYECERYVSVGTGGQNNQNPPPFLTNVPVVVNPITNQVISKPNTALPNSNRTTGIVLLSLLGIVILFYPSDKKK